MATLLEAVQGMIDDFRRTFAFRAVMTQANAASARIIRIGEDDEDGRDYAMLDIYPPPQPGDDVLALQTGTGWFVLGKIIRPGTIVRRNTLQDLTIEGTLTIAEGGVFEFHLPATDTEYLRFVNDDFPDNYAGMFGRVAEDHARSGYFGLWSDGAGTSYFSQILVVGGDDVTTRNSINLSVRNGTNGMLLWQDEIQIGGTTKNIALFGQSVSINYQSMQGGLFVRNASAVPTGDPASGGFLYAEAGALKWRGSSGTVTTIATA